MLYKCPLVLREQIQDALCLLNKIRWGFFFIAPGLKMTMAGPALRWMDFNG